MNSLTLGSLFSGAGGWELGAMLNGIRPVWSSEIELLPLRVTTKRIPWVVHLGDINTIDGGKIEPVDIITLSSPCQDVSVANSDRSGIHGKRSGLFFEAIRVIKEMRNATSNKYPKYICFEQVPGAFSADGRNAFREMLEAILQIVEPEATVPPCDKSGWPTADLLLGNGWSLAYRVLDAKWYLPQRRSRIYAVCSFTNECACDVLFEREGVCRNIAPGIRAWEGSAGDPSDCAGTAVSWGFEPGACSRLGGHFWKERTGCLRADTGDNQVTAIQYNPTASRIKIETDGLVQTLTSRAGTGGNSTALALSIAGNIIDRSSKNGGNGLGVSEEICYTLDATVTHGVAHSLTTGGFTETHEEQAATLMARDFKSPQAVNQSDYIIRRLLPQEYGRLQGYSDDWCEGLETPEPTEEQITWWAEAFETYRKITGTSSRPKSRKQIIKWLRNPYTDSAAYKMYGNSICVPCVCFVLSGIVDQVEHETEPMS